METEARPILIIDDDTFQRRMIRIKLQTRGYEVNEARDGIEALGFLEEQSYSMVLLDIVMPQLNGWEVLDQIRTNHCEHSLPVIMMTAKDNNYDPEAAKKRGANDYLTKPIDFSKLNERLDEYVNGKDLEESDAHEHCGQHDNQESSDPSNQSASEHPDHSTSTSDHDHTQSDMDTGKHLRSSPIHSLLDGMISNLPGVFFRAIGDSQHNVQMSFESNGLKNFLGQQWDSVHEIMTSLEKHDRYQVNQHFRKHRLNTQPFMLRFPCKTKCGKTGWIECRAIPHLLPSGETVWDAMLLDVTEQKELELQAIRAREAAEQNPSPEYLPLLEMYRRHHAALAAGEPVDELSANIAELETTPTSPMETPVATEDLSDIAENLPDSDYRDDSGYIHQCAQCRRVQNFSADGNWELVADWTHQMPLKTSHTICEACAEADELLTTQ